MGRVCDVQHPSQTTMQLGIDTLQICNGHFLLEDHLVERCDEISIQESSVEDTETQASSDKLEVVQMFRVDTGCRVDLEGIVIVGGVFEETVEGVEHLM